MRAMILASGLGTRMRPLTLSTPKPLLKIADIPLIEHHIMRLREAGFTELVINHAWLGEQIEAYLGDGKHLGVQIVYSAESEPLETAGGIKKALSMLSPDGVSSFAVINGDIFSHYPFAQLPRTLDASKMAHLVLVDNPEHNLTGDFWLQGGDVLSEGVADVGHAQCLTFSGISVLSPALFGDVSDGEKAALAPLLRAAIARGQVIGEHHTGYWVDVGTPERLQEVDQFVREQNGI